MSDRAQLFRVLPDTLPAADARVRPHIEKMAAGSSGRYLADDIFAGIASGQFQLWVVLRGHDLLCVLVTSIETFPQIREMRMIGVSGRDYKAWIPLFPELETIAREHFGCARIAALHLPRFRHALPGYLTTHWLSEKAL